MQETDDDKLFIQEQDLLIDGYRRGMQIVDSGFRPDFMMGIWRGGSSVGIGSNVSIPRMRMDAQRTRGFHPRCCTRADMFSR